MDSSNITLQAAAAAASINASSGSIQQPNTTSPSIAHPQAGFVSQQVAAASAPIDEGVAVSGDLLQLRAVGRQQVLQAVNSLPYEQKAAYLDASHKCPAFILENEADPLKFLRRERYNSWAAAVRMCRYWAERKLLFGERAYLPMILTGDGALTREDVLNLRAGYPAMLPNSTSGQKVMLLDRRQCFPTASRESRIRCHFYCATVISEDERSQTEGFILLILVTMPRFNDIDHQYVKRLIDIAETAFPIRGNEHLINCPTTAAKRYAVQDLLSLVIGYHLKYKASVGELDAHFEREPGDLLAQMKDLGLTEEGIPNYLGGKWTYMDAAEWCRSRAQVEREKSADLLHECRNQPLSPSEFELKDQRTKKRERNLISSRRKRDRRKQEFKKLQDEHDQLASENTFLLAEQARLEGLLNQANQTVHSLKRDDS